MAEREKPMADKTKLDRLKGLLAKKKAERQKVLDDLYRDVTHLYSETEAERFERIMNTPEAWTKL